VFDAAKPAFVYYAPKYQLDKMNCVMGAASGWTQNWKDYENDIDGLRGRPRVWILVSHLHDQEKFLLHLLDTRGSRLDSLNEVGAAVYLYDLSEPDAHGSIPSLGESDFQIAQPLVQHQSSFAERSS
jgi:hypothetical protein